MKRSIWVVVVLCAICSLDVKSSAEITKKRYTFDLPGAGSRRATQMRAEGMARKRLLSDFISDKLSPELLSKFGEEIDVNLTPAENYLREFKVLSSIDGEGSKVVVTVQGDVDLPSVLEALTAGHVLRFGEPAPKILFMPSQNSGQFGVTKTLRALIFERLKQVGLRPVAFEGVSRVTSIQGKVSGEEARIIASTGLEYQTDYVVFIDAAPIVRPASVGGYICDLNITYTVVRPNNNIILGEGIASERGSGNSQQAALDMAVDALAPGVATKAIGQLYDSIFANSDVITEVASLKNTITLSVLFKDSAVQTQEIVKTLQDRGATVTLATGGAVDRFVIESTISQMDLYTILNSLVLKGPETFTTPVVEFSEGTLSVEIVKRGATPKKATVASPNFAPAKKISAGAIVRMKQ
jgi:hypothetical protein